MQRLKALLLFYQKLMVPTAIVSALIGGMGYVVTGEFSFTVMGIGYVLVGLLFHYLIYEIRHDNEYYFYHNLGLSRGALWGFSSGLSLVVGLLISFL